MINSLSVRQLIIGLTYIRPDVCCAGGKWGKTFITHLPLNLHFALNVISLLQKFARPFNNTFEVSSGTIVNKQCDVSNLVE